MLTICVSQLAEMIDGRLRMASMPPLSGGLTPVRRVVIDAAWARPGDVYWALSARGYNGAAQVTEAFVRGAVGTVVAGRATEPWAGKFCIEVSDSNAAFCRLARCLNRGGAGGPWPIDLHLPHRAAILRAIAAEDEKVLEEVLQTLRRPDALAA